MYKKYFTAFYGKINGRTLLIVYRYIPYTVVILPQSVYVEQLVKTKRD